MLVSENYIRVLQSNAEYLINKQYICKCPYIYNNGVYTLDGTN